MRVICIGDSITYGQNVRADEAWPAVLERLTGHDVRNAGVCGDTTRLALERFPRDVQLHKPGAVVIQFGHNDANQWETDNGLPRVSNGAYQANVAEMVQRSWMVGATPLVLLPYFPEGQKKSYDVVGVRGVLTIALSPEYVLGDGYGVHPNAEGHRYIAKAVSDALP